MNKDNAALIKSLEKLITFLRQYEEYELAEGFDTVKKQLLNNNIQGIVQLAQMREGAGSINDLVICKLNGHSVLKSEEDKVNKELMEYKNDVLVLARQIRKAR
jgi:hypothetical protein